MLKKVEYMHPFHLAIPVNNLEICRAFYKDVIGCDEGRSAAHWVDFNFFGHQLVIHEKSAHETRENTSTNFVDGKDIPVPHFGVVLSWEEWTKLSQNLKARNIAFIVEPYIRFKGQIGEQATMFFLDPENNAIEFKAFKDQNQLFAK